MALRRIHTSKKTGLHPGAVVFVGVPRTETVSYQIIDYDADTIRETETAVVDDCLPFRDTKTITWINVTGLHDAEAIEKLGRHYDISPMVLEDVVHTRHRPKLEETDRYIFIILKMLYDDPDSGELVSEHVSLVFGKGLVLSFQEKPGDVFAPVRTRLKKSPRSKFLDPDYLAYSLMDAIVDHYFLVLERVAEQIEPLEDSLITSAEPKDLESIYTLKRRLIDIRKAIWPLREVVGGLERSDSDHIRDTMHPYLRDLYEHVIHVIDSVETYRETVSSLLEMYMSSVSNKMNEVMKVLTIIATLFIPLGFLAGVYGMNFNTEVSPFNLPELGMRYGYPMFWLLVVLIAGGLFWFFRRRRWI